MCTLSFHNSFYWSCICLLAFAGLVHAVDAPVAAAGPLLQAVPETVALGTLDTSGGQRLFPAAFTLRNAGTAPLVLGTPRTSCGCTKAQLEKRELSPGETTKLEVSIDINGRYGQQRFHVYVNSNAPDSPQRLTIEATVPDTRTGWTLMPPVLTFRDASRPVRVNVRLFDQLDNVQVTAVELPAGCRLLTELPLAVPGGRISSLEIVCTATALAAGGRHPFIVHASHPDIPQQKGTVNLVPKQNTTATAQPPTAPAAKPATATAPERAAPTMTAPAAPVRVVPIQASVLRDLLSTASELSDIFVLDVRSTTSFAAEHIPRSHSYPAKRWSGKPFWPATAMLVLVADDDVQAEQAAAALLKTDCRHILLLQGGFPAWKKQFPNHATTSKK